MNYMKCPRRGGGPVAATFLALAQTSAPIPANLLNGLERRSIGPAATAGRIADIAVSRFVRSLPSLAPRTTLSPQF
jgi:hypothetical protein